MVNINGLIIESNKASLSIENRGLSLGDAVFETIKVNERPLFWETHYFRLMSSMRILRMEIPMHFTLEFLEIQIMDLLKAINLNSKSYRIKLIVYRSGGGSYTPDSRDIEYMITAKPLANDIYLINESKYEIELFKDYFVAPNLLSNIKTNNKVLNVVGSIFAQENNYQNCLILNTNRNVIEALNGNVFLLKDGIVKTPPLSDGCLKGVLREQVIKIISDLDHYIIQEVIISPFELQKADAIFITNVIQGIISVTNYRKKTYSDDLARELINLLNTKISIP
jgi:branched-chain amino acid aminotransferase